MSRIHLFAGTAVLALALAACGDDATADGTTVAVELSDYAISASPASAPAGTVTFELENTADQVHEFVVVATSLGADDLPVGDDGDVDEEGAADIEVVDEVEDVEGGATATLAVDLDAGNYVLFCNLPGHYARGMTTGFQVT
jgi:uncharacterized cupredoxin-like copper-binding protein